MDHEPRDLRSEYERKAIDEIFDFLEELKVDVAKTNKNDLRDVFAGKVLCGMCSQMGNLNVPPPRQAANLAYQYADAMIMERMERDS